MADALVSVYVRPEGAYITSSDRTTVGLGMESDDWELVSGNQPAQIGGAVKRHLEKTPRSVPHPERGEFSTLRAEAIKPLLGIAGVRTWKAFITPATLVKIEGGDAISVMPMRRDGHRLDAFVPLVEATQELSCTDAEPLGRAILAAARATSVQGLD